MPWPTPAQDDLFGPDAQVLPPGLRYEPAFLSRAEEAGLLARCADLPLAPMRYHGHDALRRVLAWGSAWDFDAGRAGPAAPLPGWLLPLRDRVAQWAGLAPADLAHVLLAEYRPGTPLGWHRDVPQYEDVAGVSLAGDATMQLRPWPAVPGRRARPLALELAPRSAYLLRGPARWGWQHRILPTPALRYSLTFRTARR